MLNMFLPFRNELKKFDGHLACMHENKKQNKVARKSEKSMPCTELKNELFTPSEPSNMETSHLMEDLCKMAVSSILEEIRNPNKAAPNHLPSANRKFCWENAVEQEKNSGLCMHATSDIAELSFGSLTETLTCNSTIGLNDDRGIAMVRQNGDFDSIRLHACNKDAGNNVFIKTLKHHLTFICS